MAALKQGVAIVTGGGSGMGRGIALRFASLGTRVIVVGRSAGNVEETVALIRAKGGEAQACLADVSVEADVIRMVTFTTERYGRLDFAANVAGVAATPKPLHEMSLAEFEDDHAVNSRGVFLGMKYQIPAMLKSAGGSIVNVTSGAALGGFGEIEHDRVARTSDVHAPRRRRQGLRQGRCHHRPAGTRQAAAGHDLSV